ncbi:DUF6744 family protein [Muricomes intestini]|uniref:DUF6744 family protein n=1 Tax=Muricomes intestini TaxID=1796634 RepID=UPI002FDE4E2C
MSITNMSDLMAVKGDSGDVLGKFLYFSLASVQVERNRLTELCQSLGIPYAGGNRKNKSGDAFRSATGDLYQRVVDGRHIYKVYCRDNQREAGIISRELVKETLGAETNKYVKLANIQFDRETEHFGYGNVAYDPHVDPYALCQRAEELYEIYKLCAGRKQIEGIADTYLDMMDAIKISIHGRLYFVPKTHMAMLNIFEDFIEALNIHNRNTTPLTVNSMYVLDDQKQRDKMAAEFYNHIRKEIELYQERAEHFIVSNCQSVAVMDRWVLKIAALEEKKRHYEELLHKELDELNGEFSTLRMFSQELQIKTRRLQSMKKCA